MANKKFSEFVLKTDTSDVSHIVGYNGAENVQITPANFVTTGGTGVFLPLAGGTMTGTIVQNGGNIDFADGRSANFGSGDDLQIYHDGSNSYIKDIGAGDIIINANNFRLKNAADSEIYMFAQDGGGINLYHTGNAVKLATTSVGISVTGDGAFTGDVIANTHFNSSDSNVTLSTTGAGTVFLRPNGKSDTTNQVLVNQNGILKIDSDNATLNLRGSDTGSSLIEFSDASDGNVGRIYYDHSNNFMQFKTNDAEGMRLDSSGNLGLGTSTPTGKLEVTSSGAKTVSLSNTQANTASSIATMRDFYALGITQFRSGLTTGLFMSNITGNIPAMQVADGSNNPVNLSIQPFGGNLGIGTASPNDVLEVAGNNATTHRIRINNANASGSETLAFVQGTTFKSWVEYSNSTGYFDIWQYTNNDLRFGTNNAERMRLTSGGKLGINEDSPSAKLVVNQDSLVDTEGIFVQAASNPADGGVAIFKSASKIGTISSLGANSSLTFLTNLSGTTSEKMRVTSAGDLLIGTTAKETQGVTIYGTGANGMYVKTTGTCAYMVTNSGGGGTDTSGVLTTFYNDSVVAGSITLANANTIAYNTTSDYRLKEDLQDFEGLDLVSKIPVYDYKWKADKSRSYGVMAHELEEVLPQAVSGEKDAEEMQSVDYSKIVPLLVKSIQELSAKLEALECQCEKK